jgi:glycolate oxidase FAD binding subunit
VQCLTEAAGKLTSEVPMLIESDDSVALWKEVSSVSCFADDSTAPVWRVSAEPARAAEVVARIESAAGASCYIDCFGGVIWARVPEGPDAGESVVRGALQSGGRSAGHATLVRATQEVRERIAPFQPLEPGLAALTRRIKEQFDPRGLFNPGRMYEGV